MGNAQRPGRVGIFITPALYKQGNMDGEKYEHVYVAEKAVVWIAS